MSGLSKVLPWPRGAPLTDVPTCLETLAAKIRSGEIPAATAIVVLADKDQRVAEYAYGRGGTAAETLGILQMALTDLSRACTQSMLPGDEDESS